MSEEKPSVWIVLVSLLMLFVSGAWTLASFLPFPSGGYGSPRSLMFYVTMASNISFLISLLVSMLLYLGIGSREGMRWIMIFAFSMGILALISSIILFTASFFMASRASTVYPRYPPD